MEAYYGAEFSNTYFTTKHEWEYRDKKYAYDTSDANIGLTKIYGLVSGGTASASEAILVSMMPFVDVEIIGTQTIGGRHVVENITMRSFLSYICHTSSSQGNTFTQDRNFNLESSSINSHQRQRTINRVSHAI